MLKNSFQSKGYDNTINHFLTSDSVLYVFSDKYKNAIMIPLRHTQNYLIKKDMVIFRLFDGVIITW